MNERWRPVSSTGELVAAGAGALVVLTSIYSATNSALSGPRFLLALGLGTCAVLLIAEAINRARNKGGWRGPGAVGFLVGLGAFALVLAPAPQGGAAPEGGGLRISARPAAQALFHVAFQKPIPWPSAREDWAELHRRGGIDVGISRFHLTLANDSSSPISVGNVRAEVLGSTPMPHGTDAWHYSQGEEGVGKLLAVLPDGRGGSIAPLYKSPEVDGFPGIPAGKPYFNDKYILIQPGEAYPATLTVGARTPRTIRYRLTAEGRSADRHFVVHSPVFRIVGRFEDPYQRLFARYYSKGHDPHACTPTPHNPWVDARNADRFPACPHGLGGPYEVQPPSSSKYPPGELRIHLGITPGKQSAAIDDIVLGAAPVAASRPAVVEPLLRSLGAWDRCSEYAPSTRYWTAIWDRWGLRLTFTAEGTTDCTPKSHAGVREFALGGAHVTVETDLGRIEIGEPAAQLPPRVQQMVEVSEAASTYERLLVLPGTTTCNRYQLEEGTPSGIAALRESLSSHDISGLTTTLPPGRC